MTITEQALTQCDFILDRMIHNRAKGIPADACDVAAMKDARLAIQKALTPGVQTSSANPASAPPPLITWSGPVPTICDRCRRLLAPMRTFINLHAQGVFCATCAATEPQPTQPAHRYRLKTPSKAAGATGEWLRDGAPYTQPNPGTPSH